MRIRDEIDTHRLMAGVAPYNIDWLRRRRNARSLASLIHCQHAQLKMVNTQKDVEEITRDHLADMMFLPALSSMPIAITPAFQIFAS